MNRTSTARQPPTSHILPPLPHMPNSQTRPGIWKIHRASKCRNQKTDKRHIKHRCILVPPNPTQKSFPHVTVTGLPGDCIPIMHTGAQLKLLLTQRAPGATSSGKGHSPTRLHMGYTIQGCLFHAENFYEIHGHYFDNGDHADSFD